jgi:transcriptional regulator with XRE-family HTH domain
MIKKMKCSYCKIEMTKRRATEAHPYEYKLSGLKHDVLVGIDVFTCPKCHAEAPIIPRAAELQTCIAAGLARKPGLLKGDEIRFLRKYAGLPAQSFARLIRVSPAHLSRIENGHTESLGKSTDMLVRTLTLTAKEGGPEARNTLLGIADDLAKQEKSKKVKLEQFPYTLGSNGWHLAKRTG